MACGSHSGTPRISNWRIPVLDVVYVVGVIVLFTLVGLIVKAVEKL